MTVSIAIGISMSTFAPAIFDPAATALFARFTTPPTTQRASQINTLIGAMKTAGVWSKLDGFYVMAAADAQAAQRNWIADSFNLTLVSTPTFTADRGYQGNGTSTRLTTGFNPTTAPSPKLVLNSANVGVWSLTDGQSNLSDAGNGNLRVTVRAADNTTAGRLNNTVSPTAVSSLDGRGLFSLSRADATTGRFYKNGAQVNTQTWASSALSNDAFAFCGSALSFSTRQQAAGYFGQDLTTAEQLALYNALNTYLVAVGAA